MTPEILFKEFQEACLMDINNLPEGSKYFIRKGIKENSFRLIDLKDFIYGQENPGLSLDWEAYAEFSEFLDGKNPFRFRLLTATSHYEYLLSSYECTYTGAYRGFLGQLLLPDFKPAITGDEIVEETSFKSMFQGGECTLKNYVKLQKDLFLLRKKNDFLHEHWIETPIAIMRMQNSFGWAK
jgi:hypothetical protein